MGAGTAGASDDGTAPSHSSAFPSPLAAGRPSSVAASAAGSGAATGRAGAAATGTRAARRAATSVRMRRQVRVSHSGSGSPSVEGTSSSAQREISLTAMRGALGARGVKVDVAHRLEIARPAIGAALDRAVGRQLALDRSRQILLQEARAHAGIQVIPGEELAERTAPQVERRVESLGGERVAPEGDLTAVGPAVEAGSGALGALDDPGEAPVAAGEHALQPRELAVVPAELDAAASELTTQQRLACLGLLVRRAARPTGTACAASARTWRRSR